MYSPRAVLVILSAFGLVANVAAWPFAASTTPSIIEEIPISSTGAKVVLYGSPSATKRAETAEDLCQRGPQGCTDKTAPPRQTCDYLVNVLKTVLVGKLNPQVVAVCFIDDRRDNREGSRCCASWKTTGNRALVDYKDLVYTTDKLVGTCVADGSGGWASDVVAADGGCLTTYVSADFE